MSSVKVKFNSNSSHRILQKMSVNYLDPVEIVDVPKQRAKIRLNSKLPLLPSKPDITKKSTKKKKDPDWSQFLDSNSKKKGSANSKTFSRGLSFQEPKSSVKKFDQDWNNNNGKKGQSEDEDEEDVCSRIQVRKLSVTQNPSSKPRIQASLSMNNLNTEAKTSFDVTLIPSLREPTMTVTKSAIQSPIKVTNSLTSPSSIRKFDPTPVNTTTDDLLEDALFQQRFNFNSRKGQEKPSSHNQLGFKHSQSLTSLQTISLC